MLTYPVSRTVKDARQLPHQILGPAQVSLLTRILRGGPHWHTATSGFLEGREALT
jgi:hypothetical protein